MEEEKNVNYSDDLDFLMEQSLKWTYQFGMRTNDYFPFALKETDSTILSMLTIILDYAGYCKYEFLVDYDGYRNSPMHNSDLCRIFRNLMEIDEDYDRYRDREIAAIWYIDPDSGRCGGQIL